MLLAVDVGNTNIVLGLYKGEELLVCWRINSSREQTEDQYGVLIKNLFCYSNLDPDDINDIIISSVVPPITQIFTRMSKKFLNIEPIIVGPGIKTGVNILYDNPKEVGADRIVKCSCWI